MALLSESERLWLSGKKQVSSSYARKMRSEINRKVREFEDLERPLIAAAALSQTHAAATTNGNAATISGSGPEHCGHGSSNPDITYERTSNLNGRGRLAW